MADGAVAIPLEDFSANPEPEAEESLLSEQPKRNSTFFTRPLFTWPFCYYKNGAHKFPVSMRTFFHPCLRYPYSLMFMIATFILIDLLYLFKFPPFTWEGWFALISIVIAFTIMLADIWSATFVMVWLIALYTATRIVTISQALVGFCNSSVATIALLFAIAGALEDNGMMYYIAKYVLGKSKSLFISVTRLVWFCFVVSPWINNTPIVAVMIPACQAFSHRTGVPVSKLLIPLSFSTILGGLLSNIGTSTNLIVVGLAATQYPEVSIGFFDIAYPGLPAGILGCFYLMLCARFLPVRKNLALDYLAKPLEYTFSVRTNEKLKKKTVHDFREIKGLFLFEIERDEEIIPAPGPDTPIHPGDVLKFTGALQNSDVLFDIPGVEPSHPSINTVSGKPSSRRLVEAVVSHHSPIIALNPREAKFRTRYDAAVIAVSRHGERINESVSDIIIQPGDTLLLEASPTFMRDFAYNKQHFSAINNVGIGLEGRKPKVFSLLLCLGGLMTVIILAAADVEELFILCALLFCLIITLRLQTWQSALSAMDGPVLFQIAASFVLGTALTNTGVAKAIGDVLLSIFERGGGFGVLYGCYITTALFTAILTNAAAATTVLPITQSFVDSGLVTSKAVTVIVMLAASCDFMTSIGYQTNIMVTVPGNYVFADFTKFGGVLTLLVSVIGTLATDYFYN